MCLLKCCLCRIEKDNIFFYKLVLNRFFYKDINDYIISFIRPNYKDDYNKIIDTINRYHLFINLKLYMYYKTKFFNIKNSIFLSNRQNKIIKRNFKYYILVLNYKL
jgi:predicted RNA-binding protein